VPLLESTPLIVIGYRGAEPSIMESLLGAASGVKFRHGIYWCVRNAEHRIRTSRRWPSASEKISSISKSMASTSS